MKSKLNLIRMTEIHETEVEWLWYPYIPFGKITIVQGDPGEGKTTFILQLAALLTRGETLPDADMANTPINVIYQTAEDGLGDTIKPRLLAANADCDKVLVIDESATELSLSDERIEQAIQQTNARLIVLDPIQAYMGAQVDMHRANEIRPLLKRLALIAEFYHCAIVLVGHMNKASAMKSTYRGLGSIDFQAAARSVLIVGRIKDDPTMRVVVHDKSSLAPEGKALAFELSEQNGFEWKGHYAITAEELLSGGSTVQKSQMATRLLEDILSGGAVQQSIILDRAKSMDISKRTLDQAKKAIGVKSFRSQNKWFWKLE